MKRILVLNPGSTSTKIAVYEDSEPLFVKTVTHTREELAPYRRVADQYDFRRGVLMACLNDHGISLESLDAVVSRGGLPGPILGGAYAVNEDMVWQLKNRPYGDHASNIGALIAYAVSREMGIPAYIYDGITVDEMDEINKITGLPSMRRSGFSHTLNTRAAARRWAQEHHRAYGEITVIVAHLGGGITINLHTGGHIADVVSDDEGPFSPERTGGLPMFSLIDLCYSGQYTREEMSRLVNRKGGLNAYFGTTDSRKVEELYKKGDETARLVYDAMALGIAKNIGKLAPYVNGKVDAVILTGGIAHSSIITEQIRDRISFLAPVEVYPGEDEMQALADGCLRVLCGKETARSYRRSE